VPARRTELGVAAIGVAIGAAGALTWTGDVVVVIAGAVLGGSLGFARHHPLATWIVATAALLATVPQGLAGPPTYALVLVHAFCAGRWSALRPGLAGVLALIVVSELAVLVAHDSAVPAVFLPGAAWFAGRALRDREEVARRLSVRARELDEEREAHAQLSVRYERTRIAAELHDVVAHALSVMVVQASAGQRLATVDPGLTAEAFQAIAGAAHQAERDVGRLVDLLGDVDGAGPGPDVAVVEELVERAAESGLKVALRLEGERERLSEVIGQTAYRVVQEGLTNALRHASGSSIDVLVRGERDALVVEVVNGPPGGDMLLSGVGTGTGLTGLRERIDAVGGRLEAGPTADGGWRLSARLKRRAAPSDAGPE
jgi:signal transduction histidine kinase